MTSRELSDKLCNCGCGQRTFIATRTRRERGQVAGKPLRYVLGHTPKRPPTNPTDKFFARVQMPYSDGDCTCWQWLGGLNSDGYGRFYINPQTGYVLAHRWAYEAFVGPIPEGLTIDHLCRVTQCVNPDHMETVTNVENVMRGDGACARNARKTHCKNGHKFTSDNIYRRNWGGRECRACIKLYGQRKATV